MRKYSTSEWNIEYEHADPDADADADRLADKYHVKRVYEAMDSQYKEMGMTSVVFVCYTRPDGKLAIDT